MSRAHSSGFLPFPATISHRARAPGRRGVRRGPARPGAGPSRSSGCGSAAPSCCGPVEPALSGVEAEGASRRRTPPGQADRPRARRRPLPGAPPHDRRAPALEGRRAPRLPKARGLAAFDFPDGTLILTEAGTKRRASLHLVRGEDALAALDRGGLEAARGRPRRRSAQALRRENHTLKRALTDPHILSGIGNAYSDEILHRARLSPLAADPQPHRRRGGPPARRHRASVLSEWIERLRAEARRRLPREGHRLPRRRWPCTAGTGSPARCAAPPSSASSYAENEANYCPRCQTGGQILADRSLSRLLKDDWPRTIEELEALEERRR